MDPIVQTMIADALQRIKKYKKSKKEPESPQNTGRKVKKKRKKKTRTEKLLYMKKWRLNNKKHIADYLTRTKDHRAEWGKEYHKKKKASNEN